MPTQKRRHSKGSGDIRYRSRKLPVKSLSRCKHCGAAKPPHAVCPACGYYKDVLVRPPKTKEAKKKG